MELLYLFVALLAVCGLAGITTLYFQMRSKNEVLHKKLAEREAFSHFPQLNPHPIMRFNAEGILLFANPASQNLLKYWNIQTGVALPNDWKNLVKQVILDKKSQEFDIEHHGHAFLLTFTPVQNTKVVNCYGLDVTEKQKAMDEVMKKTLYDPLTHLPNRTLLLDYLKLHAEHLKPKHKMFVFMITISDLAEIVTMHPDAIIEALIIEIKDQLESIKSLDATIGKPSERSFTLIESELFNHGQAINVAQKILNLFAAPLAIGKASILPKITIGISVYPDDSQIPELILRNAKLAQSRVVAQRKQVLFYQSDMDEQVSAKRRILVDLHQALNHQELMLYYQAQWSISKNCFIGAEALLRWKHPTKGFISPFFFVAAAEESGLIIPIGRWVIETACQYALQLRAANLLVKTAINLSAVQLMQENFVEDILEIIQRYKVTPDMFELEITEGVVIQDIQKTIEKMHELRKAGFSLAIDDFGTGYSSLSYLQQFPVQKLKIDRAFIKDMDTSVQSFNMTRGIIELGHSLNLNLVAEGAESAEQVNLLQKMNCDIIQGYYFSKPVPFDQYIALLTK